MIDFRLNSYLQCQRKTDRISDNFPNKTNKYLHDITRTCKKSLKPLTESPKDTTNYNGPGGTKSGGSPLYSRRGIFDAGGAFAPLKHKKSTCQGKQSMVPEASLCPLTAQPAGEIDFVMIENHSFNASLKEYGTPRGPLIA